MENMTSKSWRALQEGLTMREDEEESLMMNISNSTITPRKFAYIFLYVIFIVVAGCSWKLTKTVHDGTRVKSSSQVYSNAAKSLLEPCRLPAEFGRCGCFLDGLQTSCDIVNRCLENGFCVLEAAQ
jgi:hypothetical protein